MVNTGDAHLHTATEVMGHAMQAEDGEIGHVKDVLVDDKAWAMRSLVVDTEKWTRARGGPRPPTSAKPENRVRMAAARERW